MTANVRKLDPPQRPGWVRMLPPHKKADALLREYLGIRLGIGGGEEKVAIRSFLRAVDAACVGGNPAGITLKARRGVKYNSVMVYAVANGPRRLEWLPVLVTDASDRLKHIVRETGADRLILAPADLTAEIHVLLDNRGSGFPPKVQTTLIPGRAIGSNR